MAPTRAPMGAVKKLTSGPCDDSGIKMPGAKSPTKNPKKPPATPKAKANKRDLQHPIDSFIRTETVIRR
jgi:hypothetical protein